MELFTFTLDLGTEIVNLRVIAEENDKVLACPSLPKGTGTPRAEAVQSKTRLVSCGGYLQHFVSFKKRGPVPCWEVVL